MTTLPAKLSEKSDPDRRVSKLTDDKNKVSTFA